MINDIPSRGSIGEGLRQQAHRWWVEAAGLAGVDLSGFDADAPLEQRLSWALTHGLTIGTVYSRFSSKLQHSTDDQVRVDVKWAAQHGIYTPPEFVCVDEAVKGSKVRRDGLARLRLLLKSGRVHVLVVYKVSRLFRHAFRGFQMVQEEIVEEGLRAVSVSQGIDTDDKKMWKAQLAIHGLLDDMLLDAIADHCREGLTGLFLAGHVTGALTVGYEPAVVAGAPPTNKGRPRTIPAVDEKVAAMIRQHFEWVAAGMGLSEGLRRWRKAGGPSDRRSTTGKMSYQAYRRMLCNSRYTGVWHFGRKRNKWSSRRDYTRQEAAPEGEVKSYRCEELRIVSDDLYLAVQVRLQGQATGPRPPRSGKIPHLWDLVTGAFHCARCKRRFHVCGAHGHAMRCPSPDCPQPVMVDRREAVGAVCARLSEMILSDHDLTRHLVAATQRADAGSEDEGAALAEVERKVRVLTNRISDLTELAGEGSDDDRAELKTRIKAAQAERTALQLEVSRRKQASADRQPLTEGEIRVALDGLEAVLRAAGAGELGPEAVYKAADVFRRLVGERVSVRAEARAGRKRATVVGRFTPRILNAAAEECGAAGVAPPTPDAVDVWLRCPPRLDSIAPEVRRLYEDERLGFRVIAERLGIGCGNVYASYARYYEMRGLPVPPRRPRGRQRRQD